MGRGPPVTERERGRILGLREGRRSIRDIASLTNRSKDTVSRVISEHNATKDGKKPKKLKPLGRPPALS
ncbi:hypothetical protein V7S43_002522 [Phytophthora oleae]|uniref:Transposase IS30-like HTH domain-containing protein n=1 Tax=Phytophthora oleae TaxID=2107226 RepID=A0ABD3G3R7_9STRA